MSQTEQLARALVEHAWAMRHESLQALADLLRAGVADTDDGGGDGESPAWSIVRGQQQRAASGSVALVPVQGVIRPRGGLLEMLFGLGGGLQRIRQSLSEAAADDSVGAIVLDVDSPGGVVDGVPETAAQIRRVAADKPVVAAVNTQAGSAAYWLAAQASEVVITPSGSAGSIGVFVLHENIQGLLEAEGVELTLIRAGRYKIEANPYQPLSDEAREFLQDTVDRYYSMFTGDVAKGRGVKAADVRDGYGQGRMLLARPAVDEGLADRIGAIDDAIARAAKLAAGGGGRRSRAEVDDADAADAEADGESEGDGADRVELTADDLARPWVRDLLAGRVPAGSDDDGHDGHDDQHAIGTGSTT